MNREILFKAKTVVGDAWAEGLPHKDDDGDWCISNDTDTWGINRDTLCQFTGLTDKNGVKIFEGDLVRYEAIVKTDSQGNNAFFIGSIEYWYGSVGCGWRYKSGRSTMMIKTSHPWRMEVIGTIHEEREVKNG